MGVTYKVESLLCLPLIRVSSSHKLTQKKTSFGQLFSEFGFHEGGEGDQVQDHVDEEQSGREDEGDAEVEPPVHEHVQLVTLVAVLLLEVVGAVDVPSIKGKRIR